MMTLSDFYTDYYRPMLLRGRSANTSRLYANTIRQYGLFLGRLATVDDLNDLEVSRFLEHRSCTRSPYTSEKERNQLCSLWRCASDRRVVADRPCVPQ